MTDRAIRSEALDPTISFIVQAPAGSGKTELLTQRFLALLLTVKEPEEILAVTFTRKAASEMRQRIIERLAHSEAAKRNVALGWRLIENPNRLRIMTIDALCAMIAHQMPILSHSGGKYEIAADATPYYVDAVENLLLQTTAKEPWYEALKTILVHFDNRIEKIKKVLALLLSKREQWLIYLGDFQRDPQSLSDYFQVLLNRISDEHIANVKAIFPKEIYAELKNILTKIEVLSPNEDTVTRWKKISAILLTKEKEWRKQFTKTTGFLSPSTTKNKDEKKSRKQNIEDMQSVMAALQDNDALKDYLGEIGLLPSSMMQEEQLKTLYALGTLLPVLAGFLKIKFKAVGKVDFSEVALSAFQALGDDLDPTELALRFDYQIKHILVDEYQDTSIIQFRIFEKLVAGWQTGEGRSLFLVGDPMQSIYRFRGAEVNLFLRTQQKGLGGVVLKSLNLSMNFRSNEEIVSWINRHFSKIFPAQMDEGRSAISYFPAKAAKQERGDPDAIVLHPLAETVPQDEYTVNLIEKLLALPETGRLAVLVRSRNHLNDLLPLLKRRKMAFIAHEAEHLADRQPVIDLMTLIFAVLDFEDKVAWMALLRSPLVGLTLAELLEIAETEPEASIWDKLQKNVTLTSLGSFVEKLQYWLTYRYRTPLGHWIRGLWTVLGGPQCYPEQPLQKDFEIIFTCLEEFDQGGRLSDRKAFQDKIEKLYADVIPFEQTAGRVIEIMTIHKAKGLEFDTVILPHTEGTTRQQETDLLIWQELPHSEGIDLIFAAMGSKRVGHDELYQYIRYLHKQKEKNEMTRLFYVAVSRAKKSLHIIGVAEDPPKGSFLEMLIGEGATLSLITDCDKCEKTKHHQQNELKRLPQGWQLPADFLARWQEKRKKMPTESNVPELSDPIFRAIGTVFHRAMQWGGFRREEASWQAIMERALLREGVPFHRLNEAAAVVIEAWKKLWADPKGQWILDPRHTDLHHEWAITLKTSQGIEQMMIDFAFIDENNTRWIIDYKIVQTKDFAMDSLREKYAFQLNRYASAVSQLEKRVVKKALYFPLQQVLVEI